MKATGGGTALDLGVYCAQLVNLIMENQRWAQIHTLGHLNDEGCDLSLSTCISYPGRQLANLVTNQEAWMDNRATVTGTKGIITVKT